MPVDTTSANLLCKRLIIFSVFGMALASAVFLFFPQIDMAVSQLFTGPEGHGFPLGHLDGWKHIRSAFIASTDGLMIVTLLLLCHNLVRPGHKIGDQRSMGFMVTAYLLGPGLLVNGIFKAHWGRARPRDVIEFGGANLFSPPVLPADQCARNCSFVSGEASAVATVAIALLLLIWPRLDRTGRIVAMVIAALYVSGASGLRIAFGGHFLSDTIFAVLMMGVLVPVLHQLMLARPRRAAQPEFVASDRLAQNRS